MSIVMSRELATRVREEVRKEVDLAVDSNVVNLPSFVEMGSTGLNRFGGHVFEEFLPQLKWPRAGKIYREMSYNDPVIGAILYVCEQLIRRASWRVEPGGPLRADEEAKEFLESCMEDTSTPWTDTIAEVLTMLTYGFSWHEEVYKRREGDVRDPSRRSKYVDGRIGWRKLPGRAQHTLHSWVFDESDDGGIIGMVQHAPPRFEMVTIPLEKSLLFRTRAEYNNPEGRSLLRNAYRSWYFKKHIEEIEGIGIERDLAGLPVLTTPEGIDIWNIKDPEAMKIKQAAERLVRNIRRDQNEGVVKPYGWELTLLTANSRRQFNTNEIINRYDQRIAITLLADIVMMGGDKVGSFALANVKKSMLGAALEAILESIAGVFNRYAIPRLFKVNAFPGITNYPSLITGEVHTPSLTELSRYIQSLSSSGMPLFPDDNLEAYLRNIAGMPAKNPNASPTSIPARVPPDSLGTLDDDGDARLMNFGPVQEER